MAKRYPFLMIAPVLVDSPFMPMVILVFNGYTHVDHCCKPNCQIPQQQLCLAPHFTRSCFLASWSSDDCELRSRAPMTMHWLGCDGDTLHIQNVEGMLTHVSDCVYILFLDVSDYKHCYVDS